MKQYENKPKYFFEKINVLLRPFFTTTAKFSHKNSKTTKCLTWQENKKSQIKIELHGKNRT